MINWLILKYKCLRYGHVYGFEAYTLGGHWIRCVRNRGNRVCGSVEEYLPGVHEPKGYFWFDVYENRRS